MKRGVGKGGIATARTVERIVRDLGTVTIATAWLEDIGHGIECFADVAGAGRAIGRGLTLMDALDDLYKQIRKARRAERAS